MALQVYNPTVVEVDTNSDTVDPQRSAEELIARFIAEIKQNSQLEETSISDGDWIAAAAELVDEAASTRRGTQKFSLKEFDAGLAIQTADENVQKAAVFLSLWRQSSNSYADRMTDRACEAVLSSLLRRKLQYTDVEITRLLVPLAKTPFIISGLPIAPILTNVERHVAEHGLSDSIRDQLKRMAKYSTSNSTYSADRKVGKRIDALLASPKERLNSETPKLMPKVAVTQHTGESAAFNLNTGEAWANALLIELGKLSDDSRNHWHELLRHCGTAKSSKPTKKFVKQSRVYLEAIGSNEFVQVISSALLEIGQPGECERFNYGESILFGEATQVHSAHVDCLRGLIWSTSLVNDDFLIGVVGDAAEKCFQKIREIGPRSPKIGNACLIALSSFASESAVAQLGRLKSRAKHASTRKQIAKAFQQAAVNAGMTEDDLIEISVPKFGMTEVGSLHETFGDFTAEATISANRKHQLVWRRQDGKVQKTIPTVVKASFGEQVKQLKKRLRDIDKLMPSLRHRIEYLFLNERVWSLDDFRKRFLDHPLVGVVARQLIWNAEQSGELTAVFW